MFLILFGFVNSLAAQEKMKPIVEVSVIKFDNYDNVDGEQKLFFQRYLQDSLKRDVAPHFDIAFALTHFRFPPPNDTLAGLLAHKKTPACKPAEYDTQKRLVHYYRNPVEHYIFEYNTFGNLASIQRWGVKHKTAQLTFIYIYERQSH
ncbi:MAG: hypothetical protein ACHQRM_00085 [Bacteroidia bacterium]